MTSTFRATERLSITQVIEAGVRNFAALGVYAYLAELNREELTTEDLNKFSDQDDISTIADALDDLVEAGVIEEIEGGAL